MREVTSATPIILHLIVPSWALWCWTRIAIHTANKMTRVADRRRWKDLDLSLNELMKFRPSQTRGLRDLRVFHEGIAQARLAQTAHLLCRKLKAEAKPRRSA